MILVFSILTSLHISDTFQFSSKINITNVLHQYTQLCGPKHLCNTSSIVALSSVNGIFDNWSPCPDCSCDSNCYSRDNCCPDKLSTTCENTVLVIGTAEDNGRNYTHMVSECPENTEADLISKCNEKITKKNYLQKYPVTGYTSQNASITFKNRDCAICNNVHNFNTWNLDISCSNRQFSITQYSSAEEIWDAIESDTSCTMKYDPADDNGIKPCKLESNLVNKCNVTGIWKKYDRDIEWACEKYDQKFGVFRNVFCYLCNIDEINLLNLSHVKECNVTGLWTKYSAKISKACLTKKSEPWFLPFYNRYCFHCNTNGKTRSGVLIDSKINMKESFHPLEQSPFFTNITISFLKEHNSIENEKFDIKRPSNTELYEEFGINITWLYTAYREAGGKSRWCSKQFQTGENGECLCDPSCYFIGLCCPDFVLTATTLVNIYSTVLFGENANNNSQRYILIGSCPKNYKNKTIVQKCENPVVDDITTLIPVNNQDGYKYRNMYCNFCNNGTNRRMKFWKIHLKCPVYVSFKHFTSLKTLLTFAATTGCIGRTMPPEPETKKETFVAKCNVTGDWTSYDRHIEYACENPLVSSLIAFPSHKKEFQNVFCKMCNYNHLEDIRPIIKIDTFSIVSKGTLSVKPFRTLFSLKDLVDDSESKHHNGTLIQGSCESKYVYDVYKIKCRKIFCALGKRFKNGKCVPLFDYVYDLKYQIAIRLESEYLTDLQISKTMEAFHSKDTIISKITETLSLYQNTNTTSLDWYYAQFNLPCHASGQRLTRGTLYATQSEPHNNTDVQILEVLINFCVGIKTTYSVSRTKIEEQLLNITQNPVIFQVGNESLSFRPKLDKKALYLKSTIHLTESESHCNVLREEETRGNSDSKSTLRPLLVNRLLFCAQIEIGPEEFTFISDESIRIKGLNSILGYEKYQMHPNDKIRLCVEDYIPSQEMKPASVFHLTLEILTFICICLSIVCLLLTLIAHILFPVLQSLAGKNIICLAFSLIFSQISFFISNFAYDGTIFCQIIGATTHYFWMSYFCCMNICSFHMYSVFTSTSTLESPRYKDRKLLTCYCFYSFGIPLVIVLINVAVGLILNDGNRTLYGGKNCFHREIWLLVCFFIVPVMILCIVNVIFFSLATCKITFTKNDTTTSNSQFKISIYVKLFILTGVTWIFHIADSFFELSLFSLIVTLLDGCQGVYIFISYVCTKRVLKNIKNRKKRRNGFDGTSETLARSRMSRSHTITDSPRSTKITTVHNNNT